MGCEFQAEAVEILRMGEDVFARRAVGDPDPAICDERDGFVQGRYGPFERMPAWPVLRQPTSDRLVRLGSGEHLKARAADEPQRVPGTEILLLPLGEDLSAEKGSMA